MRNVTYSMGVSLDGYIVGPDNDFAWTEPDEGLFAYITEETRGVGDYLLGRRLYETMRFWEGKDQDASLDEAQLEWARVWNGIPKVVFSTTLSSVGADARLATAELAEEIAALRAAPGEGDIAVGGATLAAAAVASDLVDEYLPRVYPVIVGGGIPFFPRKEQRSNLELVSTQSFRTGVVALRYRVRREAIVATN